MLTILCEVPITRRKRVHLICDPTGDVKVALTDLGQALQWIADNDRYPVFLEDADGRTWRIDVTPVLDVLSRIRDRAT